LFSHVEHAAWADLGCIRNHTIPGGFQTRETLPYGPWINKNLRGCPLLTDCKLVKLSLQHGPLLQCFLLQLVQYLMLAVSLFFEHAIGGCWPLRALAGPPEHQVVARHYNLGEVCCLRLHLRTQPVIVRLGSLLQVHGVPLDQEFVLDPNQGPRGLVEGL